MRHVFGPVPSRRLGYSLGVDIIPPKYCTYDCIYCQIGKTTDKGIGRKSFCDPRLVADEVARKGASTRVDVITFSGSGEPTLNSDLGTMIRRSKRVDTPVVVITNGSLLYEKDEGLPWEADTPCLTDAVTEEVFQRINRPHPP